MRPAACRPSFARRPRGAAFPPAQSGWRKERVRLTSPARALSRAALPPESVSCIISCPIASGGPVSDCGAATASRASMETGSPPPAETRCNTAGATGSGSARVDDWGGCEPVASTECVGCFTSSEPAAERSATVPDAGTASVRREQGTARRRSLAECRERRGAMKNRRSTRKQLPRCRAPKKRSMSRRLEACCTGAGLDQRSQPLIPVLRRHVRRPVR